MASRPSPEAALGRIALFREASALSWHPLPGGRSNESWQVTADGEDYVLRLASGRLPAPVGDPRRELAVHRAAAAAGLAPEPVYAETGAGVLVTRYAPGQVLTRSDIGQPGTLAEIAALLLSVRSLPDPGGYYHPSGAAEVYLESIRDAGLRRRGEALVAGLRGMPESGERGVCHMDPVAGNLIRTAGGLQLIDWEFAVAGDPLFDVAAVIAYHDLDTAAADYLLQAWCGGDEATRDGLRLRLERLVRVHDALHWLWLAAGGRSLPGERERLDTRLAGFPESST